jgi:predicted small secreted protein
LGEAACLIGGRFPSRRKSTCVWNQLPICALIDEFNEKERPMRKSLFILPVLALTMLTACETVKGVGRDVEKTGAVITDGSRQVQNDMR